MIVEIELISLVVPTTLVTCANTFNKSAWKGMIRRVKWLTPQALWEYFKEIKLK